MPQRSLLSSASVIALLTAGCGLVLSTDRPLPADAAASDGAGVDGPRGPAPDGASDASGSFDAATDVGAPDVGAPTCAPTIVDRLTLAPVGAQGYLDLDVTDERVAVVYDGDVGRQGLVLVELATFRQSSVSFVSSTTIPEQRGPVRMGRFEDRYIVFTPTVEGITKWSRRGGSLAAPWPVSSAEIFAVASTPSEVVLLALESSTLVATAFDLSGSQVRSDTWSALSAAVSTNYLTDLDITWQPARGAYVILATEGPSAPYPFGRILLAEVGPDGSLRRGARDLLDMQPGLSPFARSSATDRSAWVRATDSLSAAAYEVGPDIGVGTLSADIALVTSGSPPIYTLSPLLPGRRMLAMSLADGLPALVFALSEGGASRVVVASLTGTSRADGPTLGPGGLSVAIAPDPSAAGIAIVAWKSVSGGPVELMRIGCSP